MAIPPIRRFARGDRLPVQAQRIWLILAGHVSGSEQRRRNDERTLTYGELALRMGYDDTRAGYTFARQLGMIGHYCLMNDLPALNAIVVNARTNEPGEDVVLTPGRTPRQEIAAVHRHDWFSVGVPTPGTFRKVWEAMQ